MKLNYQNYNMHIRVDQQTDVQFFKLFIKRLRLRFRLIYPINLDKEYFSEKQEKKKIR